MVQIDDINSIAKSLADYLVEKGVTGGKKIVAIYPNNTTPTSDLPESFVEITGNGAMSTNTWLGGIRSFALLMILNVRLLSSGASNTVRENYLFKAITDVLAEPLTIGKYHYSPDRRALVYSGKDVESGYSTKIININVKIY